MLAHPFCAEWAMFAVFACSRPIVGSKRVQPPRAVHIAMSRTIIIPVSDIDVLSTTWNDEYSTRIVGSCLVPVIF